VRPKPPPVRFASRRLLRGLGESAGEESAASNQAGMKRQRAQSPAEGERGRWHQAEPVVPPGRFSDFALIP
jgi:hypothetical protein